MLKHIVFLTIILAGLWLMATDTQAQTGGEITRMTGPAGVDGGFWLQRSGAAPILPATQIMCPEDKTVVRLIYNNTGATIWCGGANVSAKSGQEKGVAIPNGQSWSPRVLGRGGVWCTWVGGATDAGLAGLPVTCGVR